jgi:hypothetical protein
MSLKRNGLLRNPRTFIDMEDFKTILIITRFTNFVNKKKVTLLSDKVTSISVNKKFLIYSHMLD